MTQPAKKPPGQAWRDYPAKPKGGNPNLTVRLHDCDNFSTRPPAEWAAKVVARVLAIRPAKPPGAR